MTIQTKPINEIERKTGVSDQDSILILDASTGEARLASKEELRGEQGIQGIQGPQGTSISSTNSSKEGKITTLVIEKSDGTSESFQLSDGADGKNPEFQFSPTHIQYRLQGEETWKNLIPLSEIRGGTITNIERTGGTGASGTTDTYTITLSDGTTQNFQVYNGRDGDGSGDMISTNNLSDLKDKATARTNLGAESEWNKKQSIETHKDSHTFFPTIKAVYDWVTRLLNKKADLVNSKVPSSQLPEVQAIDESNLVHKSGDEEISGHKIFNSTNPIAFKVKPGDYSAVRFKENNNEIGSIQAFSPTRFQDFRKGSLELTGQGNNKITIRPGDRDCMTFTSQGEVEWKGQNRTGERKDYTPTVTPAQGQIGEFRVRYGRYKQIGKTMFCAVYLDFKRGSGTGFVKISLPTTAKEHVETPIPIVVGGHGMHYKNSFARGAVKAGGYFYLLSGIVSGLNIQDVSPLSDERIVVCGEFTYETE